MKSEQQLKELIQQKLGHLSQQDQLTALQIAREYLSQPEEPSELTNQDGGRK